MKQSLSRLLALALLAVAALSGCASGYLLDNNVQSFSGLATLPASPTYRFERLPSQVSEPFQAQLEAMADPALFNAGLRRDDGSPKFSVQLKVRLQRAFSPWADPWDDWRWGWGGRHGFMGPGFGFWGRMEPSWFHREVEVVVRDLASNRVVFESRAVNDGPLSDNGAVIPAMFAAALQGFPNPPQGMRRVNVQIGGRPAAVPMR